MAAAKKAADVTAEIADEIVNAEVAEAVEAKEESRGITQEDAEAGAEDSSDQKVKAAAKAGRRSAKGQAEAEAKLEKIEHQLSRAEEKTEEASASDKPKQLVTPTRSRLERRGKGYRKSAELIEKGKAYSLKDALDLATKTAGVKFDASVELHVNLGVDPRQADQNIRASLVLPQGTGKNVRVAVFADDKVDGTDLSGIEAITKDLEKGALNFDILISTPANMAKLGKYARLLGPRGLMPNPKSGTVTADVAKAVAEAKAGRVEYRVDSTGIVHLSVGKVSFGADRLLENANTVLASIRNAKPATVKGAYLKAIHVTTTMGPGITVSPNE